ncbi:hypothetical protein CBR_g16797 [Chara braunii]|uniref:Uncharacterized protein n=1 Tax=Chara braunii TaxID=69332 RepID=A0A388KTR5_CHABU|nr:hypothetical protein CBR_g16797 [Chara braunii]|eukprot:GBG73455.1 hypothetical protein CBR_g16797 [Chara braunii]
MSGCTIGWRSRGFRTGRRSRKKWQGMLAAAKLILDKCENASRKPSYCDMTVEERKAEQVPLGFEKAVWEAVEWKLNRPSIKCDKTLASENVRGNAGGNSTSGGPAQPSSGRSASHDKATEDSDQAAKTRRTNTNKTRMDDTISSGTALGRAMEDATRLYGEGLDKAAATLAKATSEAGSTIAAKIGDVADAMRGGTLSLRWSWGFSRGAEIRNVTWQSPVAATTSTGVACRPVTLTVATVVQQVRVDLHPVLNHEVV